MFLKSFLSSLSLLSFISVCGGELTEERWNKDLANLFQNVTDHPLANWTAPERFLKKFPYYLSGFTEDGSAIWIVEAGRWDVRSVADNPEEIPILATYIKQSIYNVIESMQNSTGFYLIVDADKFELRQFASIPTVRLMLKGVGWLAAGCRPFLKKGYSINMNFIANNMFRLWLPILGELAARVETYGTQESKWKPALAKDLPLDQIPSWYGGTKDIPIKIHG